MFSNRLIGPKGSIIIPQASPALKKAESEPTKKFIGSGEDVPFCEELKLLILHRAEEEQIA